MDIHLLPNPSQYHTNYYLTTNCQCTLCAIKTSLLIFASLLTPYKMVLVSNGGRLPLSKHADFAGFETETWFSRDAMTNIL